VKGNEKEIQKCTVVFSLRFHPTLFNPFLSFPSALFNPTLRFSFLQNPFFSPLLTLLLIIHTYNPILTQAMDSAVAFMEAHMNIPSAYVAVKRVSGETESLYYLSASPSAASSVRGKKLTKASAEEAGDEENPVERLGVSFEAFKLPEVPEDEAAEPEEGAEPLPPKAAPVPSPLIIDNAMRDKRCKFFGIPKLGAFVACPFSYETLEHEAGCAFTPADPDAGTAEGYALKKIPVQFIVAFDSVGAYRLFTVRYE
jgi:hypothetical protein